LGLKNWTDGATGPRKKFDDIFSRVNRMHERDRQTDGQRSDARTDRRTDGQTDGWTDRQTLGDSKDHTYA